MAKSQVNCENCGSQFFKPNGEIARAAKRGVNRHFCGRSCFGTAMGASKKLPEVVLDCPCGKRFATTMKAKAARHCSRGCASRFSMSEPRREAQRQGGQAMAENLISPAESLKRREKWKYAALEAALAGRAHVFEHPVAGYVFDLALLDEKVLVEFDGPYHAGKRQVEADAAKERAARHAGFVLVRRRVQPATVIAPDTIAGL